MFFQLLTCVAVSSGRSSRRQKYSCTLLQNTQVLKEHWQVLGTPSLRKAGPVRTAQETALVGCMVQYLAPTSRKEVTLVAVRL